MTVPVHVLAAVRSIPHPRQEPDMTTIDKTGASDAEFQARIAPFAAVPDPRFRDQLAEQAWGVLVAAADRELVPLHGANSWNVVAHAIVENQLPLIAAEVDARVQAAANQRAAEAERREADTIADIVLALADDFLSEFDAGKEVEVDGAYEWLVQQAAAIRAARPKYPCYCLPGPARCDDPYNWCDRAAALTSPAPAPQTGEH